MEDNDLLKVRLEKIAALKAAGIELYPNDVRPQNTTAELLAEFGNSEAEALTGIPQQFSIAGRLMAVRNFGKAAFVKIQDRKGQIQSYVAKDILRENAFFVFKKLAQQCRCILLYHYPALEIYPGTVSPVFMGVAGITINTTVLAPLVWIGRIHHTHIRTGYFVDQRFAVVYNVFSMALFLLPIVNAFGMLLHIGSFQKPVLRIVLGTPALLETLICCLVNHFFSR